MTTDYKCELLSLDKPFAYFQGKNGQRVDVFPTNEFIASLNNLIARAGGQTGDAVATALATAREAVVAAQVVSAGGVVPQPAPPGPPDPSLVTLSPAYPLSVTFLTATTARVAIAAHTRSDAASGIQAGFVDVTRGATYSIYYDDPGNAGGAVTFLATPYPSTAAPYKVVGQVAVIEHLDISGSINIQIF